jgi:hypothetical protein
MKILFHDYSSELTTEPRYLMFALKHSGIDSYLWNDLRESAFDVFDKIQPEVFVTHYAAITPDIMKYLEQTPEIKLVMNVTGMSEAQLSDFDKFIESKGITVPFVFTNSCLSPEPKCKVRYGRIYPAFDMFSVIRNDNEPLCPRAVFAKESGENVDREVKDGGVYHLVQFTNGEIDPEFDIRSNAASAQDLYNRYQAFTLVGDVEFCSSQLFFDLTMNAKSITIKSENAGDFNKFLTTVFKDNGSMKDIGTQLKDQLKARHTPFHRAGTLIKHLEDKEAMVKVEQMKGHFPDIINYM